MRRKRFVAACVVPLAAAFAPAAAGSAAGRQERPIVQVKLGQRVIDHYDSNSISVSGLTAHSIDVRLLGGLDMRGRAYKWTPYKWQPLRLHQGVWRGGLPAPVLLGIYQLQLRVDHDRRLVTNPRWLERVFPYGTEARHSFESPVAVIRDYVARLPGDEVLVAMKPWPLPTYDHRDSRLNRLFVIAYAPQTDNQASSRVGKFITTVRDGYHGRWRLLEATTQPPN